jgi:hypothetical protein
MMAVFPAGEGVSPLPDYDNIQERIDQKRDLPWTSSLATPIMLFDADGSAIGRMSAITDANFITHAHKDFTKLLRQRNLLLAGEEHKLMKLKKIRKRLIRTTTAVWESDGYELFAVAKPPEVWVSLWIASFSTLVDSELITDIHESMPALLEEVEQLQSVSSRENLLL